jgi:hypothetical protein
VVCRWQDINKEHIIKKTYIEEESGKTKRLVLLKQELENISLNMSYWGIQVLLLLG